MTFIEEALWLASMSVELFSAEGVFCLQAGRVCWNTQVVRAEAG